MSPRREVFIVMLAAAAFAAGCASKPQRPTEEITRARTLIDQAEAAGAQRYAAADLEQARDKLRRADDAADDGENADAQRLATEAALDAQLAAARTSSGEAQKSVKELSQSTEDLRREAERSSGEPR